MSFSSRLQLRSALPSGVGIWALGLLLGLWACGAGQIRWGLWACGPVGLWALTGPTGSDRIGGDPVRSGGAGPGRAESGGLLPVEATAEGVCEQPEPSLMQALQAPTVHPANSPPCR